jgi:hypothetical protein
MPLLPVPMPPQTKKWKAARDVSNRSRQAAQPGLPDLVTPVQVAEWLQTTVKAIYSKAERGSLPGLVKVGGRVYFLRSELLKLMEQERVSSSDRTAWAHEIRSRLKRL